MGSIPFHGFVENSENEGKKMLTELITPELLPRQWSKLYMEMKKCFDQKFAGFRVMDIFHQEWILTFFEYAWYVCVLRRFILFQDMVCYVLIGKTELEVITTKLMK